MKDLMSIANEAFEELNTEKGKKQYKESLLESIKSEARSILNIDNIVLKEDREEALKRYAENIKNWTNRYLNK